MPSGPRWNRTTSFAMQARDSPVKLAARTKNSDTAAESKFAQRKSPAKTAGLFLLDRSAAVDYVLGIPAPSGARLPSSSLGRQADQGNSHQSLRADRIVANSGFSANRATVDF